METTRLVGELWAANQLANLDFPGPLPQEECRSLPRLPWVKEISLANGSPHATDHETFVMIVDGDWRLGSQAATAVWVVCDSIGIQ